MKHQKLVDECREQTRVYRDQANQLRSEAQERTLQVKRLEREFLNQLEESCRLRKQTDVLAHKVGGLRAERNRLHESIQDLEKEVNHLKSKAPVAVSFARVSCANQCQCQQMSDAWQQWWSKEMRPAVVRLHEWATGMEDEMQEYRNMPAFPAINEFPVQLKPEQKHFQETKD